jgi:hypothetical protein
VSTTLFRTLTNLLCLPEHQIATACAFASLRAASRPRSRAIAASSLCSLTGLG